MAIGLVLVYDCPDDVDDYCIEDGVFINSLLDRTLAGIHQSQILKKKLLKLEIIEEGWVCLGVFFRELYLEVIVQNNPQ